MVEFGKDSAFAFNAAQKAEVQELLAKTIQTVAGGTVPYRLALAGNSSSAAPVAAQPASAQSGMASQSNAVPPVQEPLCRQGGRRSARGAGGGKGKPGTGDADGSKGEPGAGFQSAPQNATSYEAPSAPQQMGGGVASSSSPEFQASSMPSVLRRYNRLLRQRFGIRRA